MLHKQMFRTTIYFVALVLLLGNSAWSSAIRGCTVIEAKTCRELQQRFDQLDYNWHNLEYGVPNISLRALPEDFAAIRNIKLKKRLFFMALLPMILAQNSQIEQQRTDFIRLWQQYQLGVKPNAIQQRWLNNLCRRYHISGDPLRDPGSRRQLLLRVDTLPVALVLAQAANESAYGSSRFARQANNIFGEWSFTPGSGIVPTNRPAGATYEVRAFASLSDSIRSYMDNLNTHPAYRLLRLKRAAMRRAGRSLDATEMAHGLMLYSSRRNAYVADIQQMIRHNRLYLLGDLKLRSDTRMAQQSPPTAHQGVDS